MKCPLMWEALVTQHGEVKRPGWESEDNVAAFLEIMEHLVSNRVVALNSNLLMLQREEAWPWN